MRIQLLLASHCALLITAMASWSLNISGSLTTGLITGALYTSGIWFYHRSQRDSSRFYSVLNICSISLMLLLAIVAALALGRQLFSQVQIIDLSWQLLSLLLCLALGANAILIRRQHLQQQISQQSYEHSIQKIFAGPSLTISFALAVLCTLLSLLLLVNFASQSTLAAILEVKMLARGIIPPVSLLLFYWGILLLAGKYLGDLQLLRDLNSDNSPLLGLGAELKNESEQQRMVMLLWQSNESFYSLPQYLNWAIPILGFIGTVLGISLAAESISDVISATQGALSDSLAQAIAPLGIAFDTTLIALSLSVILVLLQTLLRRFEEKQFIVLENRIISS